MYFDSNFIRIFTGNGGCVAWETATTFKEGRRRANYPLLARGSIVKNNNTELCRNFVTDGPVDKLIPG